MANAFDHHVFVCTNERKPDDPKGSCARRGALELQDYMKQRCHELGLSAPVDGRRKVRINKAGCLDACAQGPVVCVYGKHNPGEGVWYTLTSKADVDAVIDQHLVHGNVVDRLRAR